jgi:hypothetical protein
MCAVMRRRCFPPPVPIGSVARGDAAADGAMNLAGLDQAVYSIKRSK